MSTQQYDVIDFKPASLVLIGTMNTIVEKFVAQGYRMTVRQLYYQLVKDVVVPNTEESYKRITGLVNDAKIAGFMDWDALEDRTREFIRRQRWDSASEIVRAAANSFHMDMWKGQEARVVVIVEKEALAGVLERVCRQWDVPLLAARGYPSGTVLREFCQTDVLPSINRDQRVIVLHLGDHDPSGIDMTRDLLKRITMFSEDEFDRSELIRIALTMDQINDQQPPPNPAKVSDSRFKDYSARYGDESWELDALEPAYLSQLVTNNVENFIDKKIWQRREREIEALRSKLTKVADAFA